jgi:hypothetical protein
MKYAYNALDHRQYVRIDSISLFQTISLRGSTPFATTTTTSCCSNWQFQNSTFYPVKKWQGESSEEAPTTGGSGDPHGRFRGRRNSRGGKKHNNKETKETEF